MFKKIFICLLIAQITACTLNNPADELQKTLDNDKASIAQYVAQNNLKGTSTASGIYHIVDKEGTQSISAEHIADVGISMYLLNGIRFHKDSSYIFKPSVGSFMSGITQAVSLMKLGEKSRFLIPSLYAFGTQSGSINGVTIPNNAIVLAEIQLNAVRTDADQKIYEKEIIENYIKTQKWTAQENNGIYYVRTKEGTGTTAKAGELVRVSYVGKKLDGTKFDSNTSFPATIDAGGLIEGWNIALKMLKVGEKGTFLIPSHLAYGSKGSGSLAPYEILLFEIERLD